MFFIFIISRLISFSLESCIYCKLQMDRSYPNSSLYIPACLWVIEKVVFRMIFIFLLFYCCFCLCANKSWHKNIKNITHVCWHFYFRLLIKFSVRGFAGGSVVKDPPFSAGDMDSLPSWETKTSSGAGRLSLHAHRN